MSKNRGTVLMNCYNQYSKNMNNEENISSETKELIAKSGKNAITLLFEFCQQNQIIVPKIDYFYYGDFKRMHYQAFRAEAKFDGFNLIFVGNQYRTKREAKLSCCLIALDYFLTKKRMAFTEQPNLPSITNEIIPIYDEKNYTIFKRFAAILFARASVKCQLYGQTEGSDKVIAGIFMVDACSKQCFLISWATGSKCIRGNCLNLHGQVVNDCHAEILTRRGFLRFLYQQLKVFKRNQAVSIFVERKGKLAIRSSLSFHLFISTAPCGDGRVFAFSSEEDDRSGTVHHPLYGKNMGLCRSKIEMGEGTVLVPDVVQTYDGIQGTERLRTMSCSDKILKWNILGLQGCLLSSLLHPVYLSSISVDHLFHFAHLSRSLCCRLGDYFVSEPFELHHPYLATCYNSIPRRNGIKTSSLATNWNISDGTVEIIDAQTGQIYPTNMPSRLCKRNIFQSYSTVVKKLSTDGNFDAIRSSSYLKVKNDCSNYIRAREHFFQALIENGFGKWLKKPIEEKMFYIAD